MNTKRYIGRFIAVITLLATPPVLSAQEVVGSHSVSLGWGVAMPMGNKNFTNKPTLITPQLEYDYRFASHFSAGLSVGYSYSDEKGLTNDLFDGDVVTGQSHRTLTLIPVQVGFCYFPLNAKRTALHPYIGVSGGVQYAKFYLTADAIQSSATNNRAAIISPNIGLRYQPDGKRVYADLRALWQFSGNGWDITDSKSQQHISIRAAIGYSFR